MLDHDPDVAGWAGADSAPRGHRRAVRPRPGRGPACPRGPADPVRARPGRQRPDRAGVDHAGAAAQARRRHRLRSACGTPKDVPGLHPADPPGDRRDRHLPRDRATPASSPITPRWAPGPCSPPASSRPPWCGPRPARIRTSTGRSTCSCGSAPGSAPRLAWPACSASPTPPTRPSPPTPTPSATTHVSVLGVQRPAQIVNYRTIGATPVVLAAGLAAGAIAALGLTLTASVVRRRRDLALLKALGFTGTAAPGRRRLAVDRRRGHRHRRWRAARHHPRPSALDTVCPQRQRRTRRHGAGPVGAPRRAGRARLRQPRRRVPRTHRVPQPNRPRPASRMKLSPNANVSPTREFPKLPSASVTAPRSGRHHFLRIDQTAACRTRRVPARVHRVGPLANRLLDRGTARETNGAPHTYAVSPWAWDVRYCRDPNPALGRRKAGCRIFAIHREPSRPLSFRQSILHSLPAQKRVEAGTRYQAPHPRSEF